MIEGEVALGQSEEHDPIDSTSTREIEANGTLGKLIERGFSNASTTLSTLVPKVSLGMPSSTL